MLFKEKACELAQGQKKVMCNRLHDFTYLLVKKRRTSCQCRKYFRICTV